MGAMIDLRSDTLTKPTQDMLAFMMAAEVGDDVFGEDPTINQLQEKAATLFGKEAALFCPSGTMTNQLAIHAQTRPGDELICDQYAHVHLYEGGGLAANSGMSTQLLVGDKGRLNARQIADALRLDDPHFPRTSLVSLENTCNKGGGSFYDLSAIEEISAFCQEKELVLHLDGARVFNALLESGITTSEIGANFDSISICLSKGLGAPVGSLLLGKAEMIHQARRIRKRWGGGMRQAGYLAAAGIYALDHHIDRLAEDHARARAIADMLRKQSYVEEIYPVQTNIVVYRLSAAVNQQDYLENMKKKGVFLVPFGPQLVRAVTHLDFGDEELSLLEKQLAL